jgi:KDO2-lipid IV(A) lauroyltransferase
VECITAVALLILWVVNLLPFRARISLGLGFGHLLYRIPGSRVAVARTNIRLCFPHLSEQERELMVRDTFRNFGAGLMESAICWWDSAEKIHAMTETRGLEHIEAARARGRGVILLGAHFSTLDLSGMLAAQHIACYAIYREQNNRVLNYVMQRGRDRHMLGCIPHTSMLGAARRVKQGHVVWYSADQDMGEDHSVYAPFFGHPAATITGVSRLARLTGAPLVMLATRRREDNSGYVVEYLPGPEDFPSEDEVADAAAVNGLIEQGILMAPAQYYWFHRRFKTQPGMAKGALYNGTG